MGNNGHAGEGLRQTREWIQAGAIGTVREVHGGRLFIVNDNDEQAGMFALEAKTARELWRVNRDEKSNWATPFAGDGLLTCLEAATGRELFRERIGAAGQYIASPIAAVDRLVVASVPGVVTVIQIAEALRVLARNGLGEGICATPAVVGDQLQRGQPPTPCPSAGTKIPEAETGMIGFRPEARSSYNGHCPRPFGAHQFG